MGLLNETASVHGFMWEPGFPGYMTQKRKWRDPRLGATRPGFSVLSSASFLGHLVQISLPCRCPNIEPVAVFVNCSVWATLWLQSSLQCRLAGAVSTTVDLLCRFTARFAVFPEAPSCCIRTVGSRASLECEAGTRQWWRQLGSSNRWWCSLASPG